MYSPADWQTDRRNSNRFPVLPHAYTDGLRQRGNLRQPDAAKLKSVGITAIFRLHGYAAFSGVQSGGRKRYQRTDRSNSNCFPILPHAHTDRLGITAIFRLHGYAAFRDVVANVIGEQTGTTPTVFQSCYTLTQTDFDNGETYVSRMQRNLKALESQSVSTRKDFFMATSALQFSHVTLGYENIITTSDLNLTIPQGDYLCIIGENGSGKSTFVKNLLGLLKPLSGEIALTGDWKRSDIGYLPQQTPAQRDFPASVREIVRSGFLNQMKHRPFYTAAEKNAAQQAMEKLGILPLQNRCYRELSGGQQQRVLLARALCAAQKLLILDEPTTGLDPVASEELYQVLQHLNRTESITIIMVTHDVERAVYYAKHILHLGQKTYTYDTAEAYRHSAASRQGGK